MTKYAESDCRNNAARIKNSTAISQMRFIVESHGMNRHDRRKEKAMIGRKNTVGVPIGFNRRTWAENCAQK